MQLRRALVCLLLLTGCSRQGQQPSDGTAQKQAGPGTTLFVQGEKGSALLPIQNNSDKEMTLNLGSGPVTDATTGSEIAGVKVEFDPAPGTQPEPKVSTPAGQANPTSTPANQAQPGSTPTGDSATTPKPAPSAAKPQQTVSVPPHSVRGVQVKVSELKGTAWVRMTVFNQGVKVGDLDLVVLDDPLNVAIDGLGSTTATPLTSTYGNTLTVNLKNNSAEFLALDCEVDLRNSVNSCGRIILPPNTSKAVPVDLVWNAFSWTDLVQPSTQTGALKLTMQVPPGTPPQMVPGKVLPLNVTLQGAGPVWLSILSLIYVGVFLFIGACLSILASTVLPNLVRKAELRKQVNELANRTSSVSTRVDSYLRVLLRLERKKIAVQLDNLRGYSPNAAEQFAEIATLTAGLLKRLTVAERLDKLRREFEDRSATAPPSVSDGINKNLDTSAVQLHAFVLNDADVAAANSYLDKAEGLLKLLDDKDAQARLIAQNYVQLRNRLRAFPKDSYTDLKEALWGIFNSLNLGNVNGGPVNPPANPPNPLSPPNLGSGGSAGNPSTGVTGSTGGTANTSAGEGAANAAIAGTSGTPVPAETPVPPGAQPAPASPADTTVKAEGDAGTGNAARGGQATAVNPDEGAGANGDTAPANPPAQTPSGGSPADFSDPKNIIAPMFFAVDHGIASIQTVLDYAIVRASVATGTSKNCPNPGNKGMERLKKHECQLLNLLGTMSWKSLRAAITLVQQMREDVYEEDVCEHIQNEKAKIAFDTQRARPFLPVFFFIAFDDPRLNGAAALDWVFLDWVFPNNLHESGWKICHYFDGKEETVACPDGIRKGVPIKVLATNPHWNEPLSLEVTIEVQADTPQPEKSGARADLLRSAIAFGVALAGLKSGALDQLAKLGFVQATVAIIALGFGADTVKNVLTQSSRPQPLPAPPTPPTTPKTGP